MYRSCLLLLAALASGAAMAGAPATLQASLAADAKGESPAFAGFSAERGRAFFTSTHGREWSCASCHGSNPTATGRHATTGKAIAPMAPSANPERFTSATKVEKWFKRNCNDVAGRACTSQEKGDVLAWLLATR